jgi:hypothetical protein
MIMGNPAVPARLGGRHAASLRIIPPLEPGTAWIEISAAGPSVQARVTLPLSPR